MSPDISFLFIDFKYDQKTEDIKICEFGRGRYAGETSIFTALTHENQPNYSPFWPLLLEDLMQNLTPTMPIWMVGKPPVSMTILQGMGCQYAKNIPDLRKDQCFLGALKTYKNRFNNQYKNFNDYAGLIIFRLPLMSERPKNFEKEYDIFKKQYPQFLYLGQVGDPYAACKRLGNSIFQNKTLKKYKPKWGVYKKIYTKNLTKKIIKDLKSNAMVIKPLNGKKSQGIMLVQKHELNDTLKTIINQKNQHYNDPLFIVEEFCQSTPLIINHKRYDPTMRVIFVAHHEEGKIGVNILGGYCKFPKIDLDTPGTLDEKHITATQNDKRLVGIPIPPNIFKGIKQILEYILPKIYSKMLENKISRCD